MSAEIIIYKTDDGKADVKLFSKDEAKRTERKQTFTPTQQKFEWKN